MTPPNLRPSNINRSKVPVPSYRGIQAANRLAAEQIDKVTYYSNNNLFFILILIFVKD